MQQTVLERLVLPESVLAFAEWTIATEPGDAFGGMLRDALGAEQAIRLVKSANLDQIATQLAKTTIGEAAYSRFGDLNRTIADSLERWVPRLGQSSTDVVTAFLTSGRFKLVTPRDDFWPSSLNDLGWGSPAALWVAGRSEALNHLKKSIAIVGSRTATGYGKSVTNEFVSGLASQGYCIVSGGAYGIDAIAHQAAISLESPTIAVMAGGVDRLYPSGNQDLLGEIAEKWALISELPPGSSPTKWRFLQRNRLIAALSRATVVVEAGWRSGSINTANHATNISRHVGAVPGSLHSPTSAGCHRLIREQVAELVTSAQDVIDLVESSTRYPQLEAVSNLGALEVRALDALQTKWQPLDRIASTAGLTHSEAKLGLTSLELDSLAEASFQGWRRTGSNL